MAGKYVAIKDLKRDGTEIFFLIIMWQVLDLWGEKNGLGQGCKPGISWSSLPLHSLAIGVARLYLPFCDSATTSLKCLNENVLGSESTAHQAFHITLLDHVGVETGWEGTLELVPHIYSSMDTW